MLNCELDSSPITPSDAYPLRILFWEATLRCNLHCEFCGSRCSENVDTADELTTEEISRVFGAVARAYDASKIMINVSGGEPLLRRDLFDIMDYAVLLGYKWGLVTNGTLLTNEIVRRLEKCRLSTLSVSVDGLDAMHDSIRGRNGSFLKTIDGIRKARSISSMENIMVTTVVSSRNIDQLPELREYLKTLPIDSWRICMVDPIGRAEDRADLSLQKELVRKTMNFIAECRNMQLPFLVTTSCSHYLGRYELEVRDRPFQCFAGKQLGSILANGDIFVCPNVPRRQELIQGNVRTDSFVETWERGFGYFRNSESRRKGICAECPLFSNCRGDSLHTWDFDTNTPRFCCLKYGMQPLTFHVQEHMKKASLEVVLEKYRDANRSLSAMRIRPQSASKDIAVVSPKAFQNICGIFGWGDRGGSLKEQIACLLGELYSVPAQPERFIADIHEMIEIPVDDSTENSLHVDKKVFDKAKQLAKEKGKSFLGFIHSHPGKQKVAMSLGDCQLHRMMYQTDWMTALNIIVNTQRKMFAAYAGPAANHIELLLLQNEECSLMSNEL